MEGNMDKNHSDINRKTVTANILWRFFERFGAYIVSFVISVVLARVLEPATYGTVALMSVVVSFLDVFVTGGFASSLIQDKEATDADFDTLLIFNIAFSGFIYAILFVCAPFISAYYENASLTWLIRVSGFTLLISGIKNLQYAFVAKRLQFKKFFIATIGGTVSSGVFGIVMAINGFGAWALVIQSVANHLIDSLILWFVIQWRPKFRFSFALLKKHYSFGWKILAYKIIYNISNSVRQLVIGKQYSEEDLSFYNRGKTYPNMIGQNITSAVNSVMLPVLAKTQDDMGRFNELLEKSYKLNAFVMLPICTGFFCVAESFIRLLIGAKWIPCVPYIEIFCVVVFLNSVEAIFNNGPMALGRSTENMILGILECVFSIVALIVAMPFGVIAIGYSMIVSSAVNCLLYIFYLRWLSKFNVLRCFKSTVDTFAAAILMGVSVYLLGKLQLPYYILLVIQILAGVAVYCLLGILFKNQSLPYCLSLVQDLLGRKKRS